MNQELIDQVTALAAATTTIEEFEQNIREVEKHPLGYQVMFACLCLRAHGPDFAHGGNYTFWAKKNADAILNLWTSDFRKPETYPAKWWEPTPS